MAVGVCGASGQGADVAFLATGGEREWGHANRLGLTKEVIFVFELVDRACNRDGDYGLYHRKLQVSHELS